MSVNLSDQKLGLAFKKQTDLHTVNPDADFWLVSKTNNQLASIKPNMEDDRDDIGRGSDFASQTFKLSKDASMSVEKRLSSEFAAWLFSMGMGTPVVVAEGTTGSKYTVTPWEVCDGLELPAFSFVEILGNGCEGGDYIDRASIGNVINDFKINFTSGPGRNNTMASANIVGCGKTLNPSGVTLPTTPLQEHNLSGSSATVTVAGIDYVANKSLLSLEMTFANQVRLDSGYFIGSGVDDGFAIRGRMERGKRQFGVSFTARLQKGSPEYTKLMAQTTGPAVVTLTGGAFEVTHNHSIQLTYHQVQFMAAEIGESDGIAIVQCNLSVQEHPTNGPVTAVIVTTLPSIGA